MQVSKCGYNSGTRLPNGREGKSGSRRIGGMEGGVGAGMEALSLADGQVSAGGFEGSAAAVVANEGGHAEVDNAADGVDVDYEALLDQFLTFLRDGEADGVYRARIEDMVERGEFRLLIDMNDLGKADPDWPRRLLRTPLPYLRAAEEALKTVTLEEHANQELREDGVKFHVGFIGSFGANHVSPRALLANYLGQMVCIEGIVTKMSIVRPKMVTSLQYCPATNKHHLRHYRDATSLDGLPTTMLVPKHDQEENPLEMDFGFCVFKDHQTVTIQEMPERAPLGQLPRSVDVVLNYDLVDSCKPGDRVKIAGVYRAISRGGSKNSSIYEGKVIAGSVQTIGDDAQGLRMTGADIQNIRNFSRREDAFGLISRSLAPSIYGHEYIKKALLLLLLGGMEKNLINGTHLRGDINILMVGDPSTAKSQLLRFVLGVAPLAVSTTGRGSTGVGLTAAVTTDPETRERRLEAGAMVLADRGIVCIDEFDKMGDNDRVAIHEVMEQQTVTIAKAGIHASLNARCSVVAAANPIYGQYDKESTPQKNVNLPDSLLSRFDLLFIVLDNLNPEHDRAISEHILRLHRFQRPGMEGVPFGLGTSQDMSASLMDERENEREDPTTPIYQRFNPLLHGGFSASTGANREQLVHPEFIRKYIHFAKSRIKPVLTQEVCDFIDEEYTKLRQEQEMKALPVTARQLESFIRLATAHAKARLSPDVEVIDAEEALKIMRYALYHDIQVETPQDFEAQKEEEIQNGSSDEMDEDNNQNDDENRDGNRHTSRKRITSKRPKTRGKKEAQTKRQKLSSDKVSEDGMLAGSEQDEHIDFERKGKREDDLSRVVDEKSERYRRVQRLVGKVCQGDDEVSVEVLAEALKAELVSKSERNYSQRELDDILERLEARNRILYRDGTITLV